MIAGDGIGPEVVAQALRVVEPLGVPLDIEHFPIIRRALSQDKGDAADGGAGPAPRRV